MIAARRFSSGIWINVEELTKELGVSRTPIRQAMKQLEAEGLVTHIPHRGIRMAEMTLEMARDLYQVREVLEGLAAGLAAEKISAEALARVEENPGRTVGHRQKEGFVALFHFGFQLPPAHLRFLRQSAAERTVGTDQRPVPSPGLSISPLFWASFIRTIKPWCRPLKPVTLWRPKRL